MNSEDMKDEELLPCPFCGSPGHVTEGDYRFYVACTNLDCFCCVGEVYDRDGMPDHIFTSAKDAAKAWNTRVRPWQPIETVPHDTPVILANFTNQCLITGSPHVWASMYVTKFVDLDGKPVELGPRWTEASFAAMNQNGEPTHWMLLPQ